MLDGSQQRRDNVRLAKPQPLDTEMDYVVSVCAERVERSKAEPLAKRSHLDENATNPHSMTMPTRSCDDIYEHDENCYRYEYYLLPLINSHKPKKHDVAEKVLE